MRALGIGMRMTFGAGAKSNLCLSLSSFLWPRPSALAAVSSTNPDTSQPVARKPRIFILLVSGLVRTPPAIDLPRTQVGGPEMGLRGTRGVT